jgi:ubiquinol-cytochrome c reductase iron-sulfur subunit
MNDETQQQVEVPHGLPPDSERPRLAVSVAALAFGVAVLGAIAFVLVYVTVRGEHQTQLLGASLLLACAGLGVGLVVWAQGAMPPGPHVEDRRGFGGPTDPDDEDVDELEHDTEEMARRSLLGRLLLGALSAVGLSTLVPFLSFGPREEVELSDNGWGRGVRLVRPDGTPVRTDTLEIGGAIPVLPQDTERRADSQVMLVRLAQDGQVDVGRGRREWTAAGHVAYSRLCSHMGCSVGLYQSDTQTLVCPCHQSAFRVSDGAAPEFGPATRPLPQLPIGVDEEGFLVATGSFDRPVGTATWKYPARVQDDGGTA